MTIRVLLADDHVVLRQVLRAALQRETDIEVAGEAGNGSEAVQLAKKLRPDVVLMDIGMPSGDGLAATRELVGSIPGIKVLAFTGHSERYYVQEMLGAGASGYIIKSASLEETLKAIHDVSAGRHYLCTEATTLMMDSRRRKLPEESGGELLGRRERQVVALVAQGMSSAEIAKALHIAKGTVGVHRCNIMRKLGLRSIAQLTKYAILHGLTCD